MLKFPPAYTFLLQGLYLCIASPTLLKKDIKDILVISNGFSNVIVIFITPTYMYILDGSELTYAWRKDGVSRLPMATLVTPRGYTSLLNFTSLSEVHTGGYQCEAINDAGRAISSIVQINVDGRFSVQFYHVTRVM